jgi:hypothetical protein
MLYLRYLFINSYIMRSISTYLSSGWNLYKTNFSIMFQFATLVFIIAAIQILAQLGLYSFASTSVVTYGLGMIVLHIITGILSLWLSLGLMGSCYEAASGHTVSSIPLALSRTRKYILPAILLSILTGIVIVSGFILLIIPGIIFSVWFAFAYYPMIIKGNGVMASFHASKALVKGKFWGVLGRFIGIGIVVYGISFIFGILVAILGGLTGVDVLAELLFIVPLYLLLPYITLMITMMYVDLDAMPMAGGQEPMMESPQV